MQTKIIEASNGVNWGKFLLGRLGTEWSRRSAYDKAPMPLLARCGWTRDQHLWVLDLQTGEGAYFRLGGHAGADLQKHRIWVCPLFEPFLTWLYEQDTRALELLPDSVELPHAPAALYGHRREGGPEGAAR